MPSHTFRALAAIAMVGLSGCAASPPPTEAKPQASRGLNPNETPELRELINRYADHYDVPPELVDRVIKRESTYVPTARNGNYYGLMQIMPATARAMGYEGSPSGLLDAETNLKYAVKYLRGAWLVAEGDPDEAVGWYSRGYYYEAKKKGLLEETGLR